MKHLMVRRFGSVKCYAPAFMSEYDRVTVNQSVFDTGLINRNFKLAASKGNIEAVALPPLRQKRGKA